MERVLYRDEMTGRKRVLSEVEGEKVLINAEDPRAECRLKHPDARSHPTVSHTYTPSCALLILHLLPS